MNSKETIGDKIPLGSFDIRHMSTDQLGALGVSQLAYVKPVVVNGSAGFAIHAADGTPHGAGGGPRHRDGRDRPARDDAAVGALSPAGQPDRARWKARVAR